MLGKHIKFRISLVVFMVFIGAVIFLSEPFTNKDNTSPVSDTSGNAVSKTTNPDTVSIEEDDVAMGVPSSTSSENNWVFISIAVTLLNLAGAIGIVFMTSKDTSQV